MKKAISTYVFVKQRLHPGMLDQLKRAGAEAIEIFAARGHFDYTDRGHVELHSMHSPMFSDYEWGRDGQPPLNLVERDKKRRVESMDEIKRAIEAAEQMPFRYLVQHMGLEGEEFDAHKFENGLSSLEHLHAFARPLGVKLLLENIPNEYSTPEKVLEFIRTLHLPDIDVCFDVGHANIAGGIADAFYALKAHIRSTHLHDNEGDHDRHMFVGEGKIDWAEVMSLLQTAPGVPPLLLEIDGHGQTNVPGRLEESFRKLEEAAAKANA